MRPRVRLYCFSYAGGSATTFKSWQEHVDPAIEINAVQLPGRGARFRERPATSTQEVVTTLTEVIQAQDPLPFALFGHSLGALLAFELTHYCQQNHLPMPVHLFVSGCAAPRYRDPPSGFQNMADERFIEVLKAYKGTPREVLEHEELMQVLLPMLRADFTMADNYIHTARQRLDIPMTVFAGTEDDRVSAKQIHGWRDEAGTTFATHWYAGDHFFINNERDRILGCVSEALTGR